MFAFVHADDLTGWKLIPPKGIISLTGRVRELVDDSIRKPQSDNREEKLWLEQKKTRVEHISISDHKRDDEAVLEQLADQPEELRRFVTDGYRELEASQYAARFVLNDNAPEAHYSSIVEHFKNAVDAMASWVRVRKTRRSNLTIEYFLLLERANALAFSSSSINSNAPSRCDCDL